MKKDKLLQIKKLIIIGKCELEDILKDKTEEEIEEILDVISNDSEKAKKNSLIN